MEKLHVKLTRDASLQFGCSFVQTSQSSHQAPFIVFMNGVNTPQELWYPVAQSLKKELTKCPPMLMYDRIGQKGSIGRNQDVRGRIPGHGRDCLEAAYDLRDLITTIARDRLNIEREEIDNLRLIFVAHSISCAIARLYAAEHPNTVVAFVLVDSTIANSDIVSVFPDPNVADFDPSRLPSGVTPELCRDARKKIGPVWSNESPNAEGLWRGTLNGLLPYSDLPKLPGNPYVTVIEHDPEVFPLQAQKLLGIAPIMTKTFFSPLWRHYNEGLANLTVPERSRGPVSAKGCGHIIHQDDPRLIADEVAILVKKLDDSKQSHL